MILSKVKVSFWQELQVTLDYFMLFSREKCNTFLKVFFIQNNITNASPITQAQRASMSLVFSVCSVNAYPLLQLHAIASFIAFFHYYFGGT